MSKDTAEEKIKLPEVEIKTPEATPTPPQEPTPEGAEGEKPLETTTPEQKISPPAEGDKPKLRLPIFRRTSPPLPAIKDEVTVKIEKIMTEDLLESYQKLSPIAQQEFKLKGEETALKINELLRSAHVQVKKIFRLIYEWLKMLPGINRFFLEQEAKIKTDKILLIKNKENHD